MKLASVNANEWRRWWNLNFNGDIHWTWQWLSSHDSRAFYCLQPSFAVWKTSLEEKRNHSSFFPGCSEGSLSLQFQLQASSTVRTLKCVQISMMPELSFQQENKRLAWRMARHWHVHAMMGWSSVGGQGTGTRYLVTGLRHAAHPQMTRLKSHVRKLYSMKLGWDKHLEIGLLLTARRGGPDASSWPSPGASLTKQEVNKQQQPSVLCAALASKETGQETKDCVADSAETNENKTIVASQKEWHLGKGGHGISSGEASQRAPSCPWYLSCICMLLLKR